MPEQNVLLKTFVGMAGVIFLALGITIIFSAKVYSLVSKTYFLEKMSQQEKRALAEAITNNRTDRYITGAFIVFFGLTAIAWAFGLKSAIGWPFNLFF
jgi:hypothetical protein